MKNIFFFICIICFFLSSCFKELDFNLDFEGEKIVVRGTISPQDGVLIQVSRTLNPEGTYFLDSLDIFLDNAIVKLYENDTFLQQITYSGENGFYRNETLNLKMEMDYHLTVEAEGFPSVSTKKISIPQLPKTTFNLISESEDEVRIDIDLNDDSKTSYYQLIADGIYRGEIIELYAYFIGSYEQWEICGLVESSFSRGLHIPDDCFKDKIFLLPTAIQTVYFQPPSDSSAFIESVKIEELTIKFRSIIKERYDFVLSTNVPEDVDNAFREPPITFSNIIGGHGYFSAYQEIVYTHKL